MVALDAPLLTAACGLGPVAAARWLPSIEETAARFAIDTPERLAMFIAQCAHESAGFTRLTENLHYSAAGLRRTWPKRFPTQELAEQYAGRPEKIANYVYAGRLGNGAFGTGDGFRFRGRGLIQLTGRATYKAAGLALGAHFVEEPDLVATEHWAALTAGWFFESRGINALADVQDVAGATRAINGGLMGLEDRKARWERALEALT